VVGPVKGTGQVGDGGRQAQAHALGHLGGGVQAAAFGAGHADVVRLADEIHAVEVQVGGRLGQRPQGRACRPCCPACPFSPAGHRKICVRRAGCFTATCAMASRAAAPEALSMAPL
jgi:hypothetical protein